MATYKHILSSLGNRPTQRNLFGPVDREQLQQKYHNALHQDLADTVRRWAFDFLSEKPLKEGDFQWEGVPGTNVPLFYGPCVVGQNQVEGQNTVEGRKQVDGQRKERVRLGGLSSRGKENNSRSPKKCRAINMSQKLEKTPAKGDNRLKRKQTNITDFYAAKRTPGKRENNKLKRKQTNLTDFYAARRKVVGTPMKSRQ